MKHITLMLLLAGLFLLMQPQPARADILDHWTTTQLTTDGYYMTSIAYGNGVYAATAEFYDGDVYFYSEDGLHWTGSGFSTGAWGSSLKFENGHFISVGGYGTIAYSTNGIDWQAYYLPGEYVGGVNGFGDDTYGNGLFVDVGMTNSFTSSGVTTAGYIISSPDGINWTPRLPLKDTKGYISGIAYGSSTFVAVGNGDGNLYYSMDGTNWTLRRIPVGGSSVTYVNSQFIIPINASNNLVCMAYPPVAPFYLGEVVASLEGTGLSRQLSNIVYSHGIYMGLAEGYLASSTDGSNWFIYPCTSVGSSFATDGMRLATFFNVDTGMSIDGHGDFEEFNGFVNLSDPLADIQATKSSSGNIAVYGLVGRQYQIESTANLGIGANWQTNATLILTNTPVNWTNLFTSTNSSRFYRAALLP